MILKNAKSCNSAGFRFRSISFTMKKFNSFPSRDPSGSSDSSSTPNKKLSRFFSFTASTDWFYRYFFNYSGLRSVTTEISIGTTMHCWTPKEYCHSKPNLVLVHGFGANAMWQYGELLHCFVPRFNVYVPDLLFFGGSYSDLPDRSEQFQARCLMKMLDLFGVMRMRIVGISYGGFVSYSLAAQFPEAVEKIVLCCTGVCLEEKDMENGLFKVSNLEEATNILVPQTPEKLKELMTFSFVKPPAKIVPSYFLSDYIDVMCREYAVEKKELIQTILKDRHFCDLPKIKHNTLIIWGEQDQVFPLELGLRLQRHIGESARLVVIKNAGHAVNLEKTKEFARHLKAFLYDNNS